MSVVADTIIKQRLWRGYDDPGLPIGSYVAWLVATGDASGGDVFQQIVYEPEAQNLTGRYFNLEYVEFRLEAANARNVSCLLLGFSPLTEGAFTNRLITLPVLDGQFTDAGLPPSNLLSRPVFLGQTTLAASGSSVQTVLDNVDGRVSMLWVEGYIWDARSNQASGGVRRPADALYG